MAILPILERKDTQQIMQILGKEKVNLAQLGDMLDLSTGTLYRRIKELSIANIIEKRNDGSLIITKYGRKLYDEFLDNQISVKENEVLRLFSERRSSTDIVEGKLVRLSPNKLVKTISSLKDRKLIQKHSVSKKPGRGRKKVLYELTKEGEEELQKREKLKKKAKRGK